jgi:hypothetical protein
MKKYKGLWNSNLITMQNENGDFEFKTDVSIKGFKQVEIIYNEGIYSCEEVKLVGGKMIKEFQLEVK